jgi:hypothetical protein
MKAPAGRREGPVRKTVGVYEKPKRFALRGPVLIAAAIAVLALLAAIWLLS